MKRQCFLQIARLIRADLLALVCATMLAACGGGHDDSSDAALPPPAQAVLDGHECSPQAIAEGSAQHLGQQCVRANPLLRPHARPQAANAAAAGAAASATLTPDMLMDWAERQYPTLFAPAARPTQIAAPYTFRYYSATGNYIGVAGSDVYVLGPISMGKIALVGTLGDFSCVAANIGCAVPGAPTINKVTPNDKSAVVQFSAPASSGSSPISQYSASCASGFDSIGVASGSSSPITVTGLANGRKYSCIVTASNQQGTSAPSAAVSVTPALPPSYQATTIKLVSDFGDYIGGGQAYQYNKSNAQIGISANGNRLSVSINGDQDWSGDFVLPAAQKTWTPGTYSGLTRYPFNDAAKGGLSWSGEGRGCNTLTGSITVISANYTDGQLDAISLSFIQNCEGGSSALRGTVTWGANDPTLPPGPTIPVPTNLWKAPTAAVPATGNYIYLQSDSGDYIGGGQTYLYTDAQSPQLIGGISSLRIIVGGWDADFVPMVGTTLQVGYYANLSRYPFHNPFKGGLNWSGNGRGCNTLSGWFAIDEISVNENQLQKISMRFMQFCEGGQTALRGQIRWTRP